MSLNDRYDDSSDDSITAHTSTTTNIVHDNTNNNTKSFSGLMKYFAENNSSSVVFLVVMLLLILSTIPANYAWYHSTNANPSPTNGQELQNVSVSNTPNQSFLGIFLVSMCYVVVEYLFVLPANELGGNKFTLFQLGLMSQAAIMVGFFIYMSSVRGIQITKIHLLSSLLVTSGVGLAFYTKS